MLKQCWQHSIPTPAVLFHSSRGSVMSREKVECPVCEEHFTKQGLSGHLRMTHMVTGEEFDELYTEAVGDARGGGMKNRRAGKSSAKERMKEAPPLDGKGNPNLPEGPYAEILEHLREWDQAERLERKLHEVEAPHEQKEEAIKECQKQGNRARKKAEKKLKEKAKKEAPDSGDRESEGGFLDKPIFGGLLSEEDKADE